MFYETAGLISEYPRQGRSTSTTADDGRLTSRPPRMGPIYTSVQAHGSGYAPSTHGTTNAIVGMMPLFLTGDTALASGSGIAGGSGSGVAEGSGTEGGHGGQGTAGGSGVAGGSGTGGSDNEGGRKRQWSGGRVHKRVARMIPNNVEELQNLLFAAYADLDEALEKLDVIKSVVQS